MATVNTFLAIFGKPKFASYGHSLWMHWLLQDNVRVFYAPDATVVFVALSICRFVAKIHYPLPNDIHRNVKNADVSDSQLHLAAARSLYKIRIKENEILNSYEQ